MNGAQRLALALSHREADRVPLDIGSTKMTGISVGAYRKYLEYAGLEALDPNPKELDRTQRLADIPESVLRTFGADARGVFPLPARDCPLEREGEGFAFTDEWGIRWRMPDPGGLYFDLCGSPLAGRGMPAAAKSHHWPDPCASARISGIPERLDEIEAAGCGAVMHGFTSGVLEMLLRLRGFEDGFSDLAGDPDSAAYLLDLITDMKTAYWDAALEKAGGRVMVAVEPDDLGTQNSLLISPAMYRRLLMPRHSRLFGFIKRKAPGVKVFLHSCGAVLPMLPLLIEAGVDILNPVQVSAAGMDTAELKKRFGRDLVFWGGGVDTQRVLPRGTPGQVRDEVRRRIGDLAPGGGFVFAAVHNVQADVPPENLAAMLEALAEYDTH
jgi:uroporphyrinogen decarboxylase